MTNEELSNEFDVLINSYFTVDNYGKGEGALEFNEYEKSVFLTKAQEQFIVSLYDGRSQEFGSFEETEEVRRFLSNLVRTTTISNKESGYTGISNNSYFYKLPEDLLFITYEEITVSSNNNCSNSTKRVVVPTTQDEYYRVANNPFRGPNNRRALRLDCTDNIVEIVSKDDIESYTVRYLSKPRPIILVTLPDNLTINHEYKETACELAEIVHRPILELAVKLALMSRSINTN